jgi:Mlc titration factor MtfA (ptsG expression regulator)
MFKWFREYKRRKILQKPFPDKWREIMRNRVPHYTYLDTAERSQLEQLVAIFIAEKNFEGCGGLTITDEISVVISAQACLLVLGLPPFQYLKLAAILVYPTTVAMPPSRTSMFNGAGDIVPDQQAILGLASAGETVVLVWDAVLRGTRHATDGHNVVYHEFAHILDMRDGAADGTPILPNRERYRQWVQVCEQAFFQLRNDADKGRKSLLDHYGAVDEAEFFAVATEIFFDRPLRMQKEMPALYQVLAGYYRQDTAARERRHRKKASRTRS